MTQFAAMLPKDAAGIFSSDYAMRSKQLLLLVNTLRGIGYETKCATRDHPA